MIQSNQWVYGYWKNRVMRAHLNHVKEIDTTLNEKKNSATGVKIIHLFWPKYVNTKSQDAVNDEKLIVCGYFFKIVKTKIFNQML